MYLQEVCDVFKKKKKKREIHSKIANYRAVS